MPYVRAPAVLYVPEAQGDLPHACHALPASLRLWYVQRTVAPQANSGVKLGNFYVQRACSPTRAALLTGRYNIRYGFQSGVLTDHIS